MDLKQLQVMKEVRLTTTQRRALVRMANLLKGKVLVTVGKSVPGGPVKVKKAS